MTIAETFTEAGLKAFAEEMGKRGVIVECGFDSVNVALLAAIGRGIEAVLASGAIKEIVIVSAAGGRLTIGSVASGDVVHVHGHQS